MTDYIKREDAIKWLKNLFDDCGNYMPLWHYGEVLPKIIELLEVDVAPVRHGRWIVGEQMPMHDIKGNLSCGNWYTCNQCEFKTYAIERHITQYNYCPNCGAKMDGGDTDV